MYCSIIGVGRAVTGEASVIARFWKEPLSPSSNAIPGSGANALADAALDGR
jgi:hypothetical protein